MWKIHSGALLTTFQNTLITYGVARRREAVMPAVESAWEDAKGLLCCILAPAT